MLTTCLSGRCLRGLAGVCLAAGALLWGCAPHESPSPSPPPPPLDVGQRLRALEECITRTQGAVKAAAEAGISAGLLAPINSGIADAQDAVDRGARLVQEGQQQAAAEGLTRALEECDQLTSMVTKAGQEAAARRVRAQMASEAETRLAWTVACVDDTRQSLRNAGAVGFKRADFLAAQSALESAETALQQGRELLAQHDPASAVGRLEAALADCQTARDVSDRAMPRRKSASPAAKPRRGR